MSLNLRLSKCAVLVSLALPAIQVANAAQQCLALPGTYGAVSVSGCDNDPTNGIFNPVSTILGPGYPYDGVALGQLANTTISCTYSFSHPILASSITVDLDIFQPGDTFSVNLDSQAYAFTDTDIVQTPLPAGSSGTDTLIQQSGAITLAPAPAFNGSAKVKVSAGQWISSLKLNMLVNDVSGGGVARVCVDDAAPPPPPPAPAATPVPVGTGAAGAATIGILGFAAFLARRRKGKEQA